MEIRCSQVHVKRIEIVQGDDVMATATFRIWRGEKGQGEFRDYTAESGAAMAVLGA